MSKQAVGTRKGKGTVLYVVVCLFMHEVYLSPGFIPGHNHPVWCHLPSGVIFSPSYVMANTLWLLLPAVASTVLNTTGPGDVEGIGNAVVWGKLQLCLPLVSFHVS